MFFMECVKYGHKLTQRALLGRLPFIHITIKAAVLLQFAICLKKTDGTLYQHRHLTIKDPSLVKESNKRKNTPVSKQFFLREEIQICCYFITTLHHFLLFRRLEGKKAPSPSLCGEPHGLSSPQLMSSQDSSLSHKRKLMLQNGHKTIDACALLLLLS